MTQEDKDLLLKDLCARLPYGIKCNINGEDIDIGFAGITAEIFPIKTGIGFSLNEDIIKPYLRPMSSMTEEEDKEFALWQVEAANSGFLFPVNAGNVVDWLLSHHFDYMGLIKKGLALEAPEGMYDTKDDVLCS